MHHIQNKFSQATITYCRPDTFFFIRMKMHSFRALFIILASAVLIALSMPARAQELDWETADSLKLLGFSKDYQWIVLNSAAIDTAVGCDGGSGIDIVDFSSRKLVKSIVTGYFCLDKENLDEAQLKKLNKELKQKANKELTDMGCILNPPPSFLQKGLRVTFTARSIDRSAIDYNVSFFIKHDDTGFMYKICTRKHSLPGPESVSIKNMYSTPDAKNYFVFYSRGSVMEFDPGSEGILILNANDFSFLYNAIGYRYYLKKDYQKGLDHFLKALSYNEKNIFALYNTACMYALRKDVDLCLQYLTQLKTIGSKEAKNKLKSMDKDSDFNDIKAERHFIEFMNTLEK